MKNSAVPYQFNPPWWYVFFFSSFLARKALYKSILMFSNQLKGRLMDFGCGSKPYEMLFSVDQYVGVDIHKSGHNHSDSKIDVFYDGTKIPFEEGSFDSIFCSEVLEHVPNVEDIISEFARVLKTNGTILLSIPFGIHEHEIPYDFRRFTSHGIVYLLKKHGFVVKDCVKTNSYLTSLIQSFIWYCTLTIPSFYKIGTLLKVLLIIFPFNLLGTICSLQKNRNHLSCSNIVVFATNGND